MTRALRALLIIVLVCLWGGAALATDAIVKRRATLRSDPSTEHPPIATLQPQEDVELIEPSQTAGYYKVRTAEGDEGWVYSRNLEIVTTSPAAPPPAPIPLATPAQPTLHAGITSNISPSWEKADPNVTTFHGPDGICGPVGDGGDTLTNKRKNRTDVPSQYHEVTWKATVSCACAEVFNAMDASATCTNRTIPGHRGVRRWVSCGHQVPGPWQRRVHELPLHQFRGSGLAHPSRREIG
jgi:hypothetical protein